MDIKSWLTKFEDAWSGHNVDEVLLLFDEGVEYWETPHRKLGSFEDLAVEWQVIKSQTDIQIATSTYGSIDNRHAVVWHLRYVDKEGVEQAWSGTYLITLNSDGQCVYFHHTGEKR